VIAVASALVLIVVLIVLLASGGSSPTRTRTATSAAKRGARSHHHAAATRAAPSLPPVVTLALRPSSVVYVCLIGDNGRKLIPGTELQPEETTPTYHARRFEVTLGNSSVTMIVDGRPRSVPPSSEAIGYTITKARGRQPLAAGQLPTCK
jgi:hypothetical protein